MSAIYDNWERLVAAVLRKEELWLLFHSQSLSPSVSSESSSFSFSFGLGSASLDDDPFSFSSPDSYQKADAIASIVDASKSIPGKSLSTDKNVTSNPSRKRDLKIQVPKWQIQHDWPKQQSYPLPLPPGATSNSSPLFLPNTAVASPAVPLPRPERPENVKSPGTRWKKGKLIGSGPYGDVYIGFNSEIGEMCAVKEITLSFDSAKAKQSAMMFEKEVAVVSGIEHPNIVRYYGSETIGNILYIYFEYVSGGSIYKILQEYGKLGELVIRSYTHQILSGLAHLHSNGITHRDIKGANILVDPNGRIKICNYGIEKHIAGESHPSLLMDSPYWTAPEVIRNPNARNRSIDIWSLGCTVLEMTTSKPPLSLHDTIANHKEFPRIPDYLSAEAKDFLRHCLQWNPVNRRTASQLLEHPFVKPAPNSGKQIPVSPLSPHLAVKSESTDHPRTLHQLNSDFHSSDVYTSRNHKSAPVSPVGSPLPLPRPMSLQHLVPAVGSSLVHPRSPQHLNGKISPPYMASSSSRPLAGGNGVISYPHLNQSVLPKETLKHSPGINSPRYWDPNILRGLHSKSHQSQDDDALRMQFGKVVANGQSNSWLIG